MKKFEIKKVTLEDIDQSLKISRETFLETFASFNSKENMAKYINRQMSYEKISSELVNPDSKFYFALFRDTIIGYLKLNFGKSQTEVKKMNSVEIERIYVLKKYHGENVGQLLLKKAIEAGLSINADFIWLGVWEKNIQAIKFYEKNGFVRFEQHIFKLGNDNQTDIMMKMEIGKK